MKTSPFVSIQDKLALIFTIIFLAGIILLTSLLKISTDVIAGHAQARQTYNQARQYFQAKVYFQQFENALTQYEITGDYDWLDVYHSSYSSLLELLAQASGQSSGAGETQALTRLSTDLQSLRATFDQAILAVDEEDWDAVDAREEEAYPMVESIFAQINNLIQARDVLLKGLQSRVQTFSQAALLAILAALVVFLGLVFSAALIIARQINMPLIQMADEVGNLEAGRFEAAALGKLPGRRDEVGYLSREYLGMAEAVAKGEEGLREEAEAIRGKIR